VEKIQIHLNLTKCKKMYTKEAEKTDKLKHKISIIENEKKDTFKRVNAEIKEHRLENKQLESKIETLNRKYDEKGKELKRTAARENYMRMKIAKLDHANGGTQREENVDIINLRKELSEARKNVEKLQNKITNIENENQLLHEQVNEMNNENIVTFDYMRKCFTSDLQMCIYSLLQHHVSTAHITSVIESVLKLAGKKASKLPSKSIVNNMNIQRLSLCQKQLCEVLPTKLNTCLYTDETTKYGDKFGGYHISDSENTMYVLGLRSLPTKSAADTSAVFNEILSDIQSSTSSDTHTEKNAILYHIKSKMSDRAATEIRFSKLLEEFRSEILPLAIENFPRMTDDEKLSIERLYNFFCGLHPLTHMADTADSTLAEAEKAHFDAEPCGSIDKSATSRLLRTAAKLVGRGADEKSGCYVQFKTFFQSFLKDNSMSKHLKNTART